MATTITPPHPETASVEQRLNRLETTSLTAGRPITTQPNSPQGWFWKTLQTASAVAIIGAAFWLGTLNNKVETNALKLDKLYDSVAGVSKDSLNSRMAVVETRLSNIESKLDGIDKKLDKLAEK